jgi:protein-S-isoprenylcysteine O-methyltransferase Ste14
LVADFLFGTREVDMARIFILLYGIVAYALAMASILYAVGFVGNYIVPKSIDTGISAPIGTALVINLILLGLFAIQHSGMARAPFKRWLTQFMPQAMERSTYVLISALLLFALFHLWVPMPDVIWNVETTALGAILQALYFLGWAIVVGSTFLINHWDLFGLRQVLSNWFGTVALPPEFKTPLLYKFVRHPIYFGFLLAFWSTPLMTLGHLLFAIATTGYILIGIWFEERDLVAAFGDDYRKYSERVPMLIPWPFGSKEKA